MSWSAASTTRGINMEYYRRIKGSPGTTAWATKRVRIWAAKGYFEFISGKDWKDCFPAGWRKKTPAQINRGSKRFIFAARNVDTDGDGVANEIQYQFMGFFGFNLKHSCMLDKSPLNFEKDVKPAFLPWVGNPTHPPLLGVWRKKELLLLLEANKRKRTGSGPEPRSSGRPKKLKFDTLKVEEDAEVAEQDDPPTSSSKGKKKSTSKGARTYLIQGIPFLVGQSKGKKPSKDSTSGLAPSDVSDADSIARNNQNVLNS
eukprot:g14810.t1